MIQRYLRLILHTSLLVGTSGLLSLLVWTASPVEARTLQPLAHSTQNHTSKAANQGHATVIVLDMSGSMVINDRHGYRCSAADAYIDLSGQNDYIGLVGLDSNGSSSGQFQAAMPWQDPVSAGTFQAREQLKSTLASKSKNCSPDSTTPTYDALNRAFTMLNTITKAQNVSGSVILLTDGAPCPDVDAQVSAINALAPKFGQNGWPIDTIALGADAPLSSSVECSPPGTSSESLHTFLSRIAGASGGQSYADDNGPVSGVSPLNLGPFFVQIFAKYSGDTVKEEVPATSNLPLTQNFSVIDGANSLDVVALKESANVSASLQNPSSQSVSNQTAGVLVSQDDYHVIYKVSNPPPGQWIINASGSGQFLMYSLTKTNFGVAVDSVQLQGSSLATPHALPLGQTLLVTAHLTSNGQPFSSGNYTVRGDISQAGGGTQGDCTGTFTHPFALKANASSYTGTASVPATSLAGTYNVLICVSTGTLLNVVASTIGHVQLAVFPNPLLLSPQTKQPTTATIDATVVQWPFGLPLFYSAPLVDRVSGWPLQGYPAQPVAKLPGQVQWNGNPYPGASIRATAFKLSGQTCDMSGVAQNDKGIPVTITQDSQGDFTAQFPPVSSGNDLYLLNFETSGSFKDSQGSFGPYNDCVQITSRLATFAETQTALLITLFLFFLFLVFLGIVHFFAVPGPFGQWVRNQGASEESNRSFGRARRTNPFSWFLFRNHIYSRQAGMPRGLEFRFRWGKRIDVRPAGFGAADWQLTDGSRLPGRFQLAKELIYRPRSAAEGDFESQARFTIMPDRRRSGGGYGSGSSSSGGSGYSGFGTYESYGGRAGSRKDQKKSRTSSSSPSYGDYSTPRSSSRKGRKGKNSGTWGNGW